jgi:hypothetical protein
MNTRQAAQWQSLESVTWTFHLAVDHLALERGTMAERLFFCTRQLSMLQPKLLSLPGSLTQDLVQLTGDLRAGRYERDPSLGDLAIPNYYSRLRGTLLDSFL